MSQNIPALLIFSQSLKNMKTILSTWAVQTRPWARLGLRGPLCDPWCQHGSLALCDISESQDVCFQQERIKGAMNHNLARKGAASPGSKACLGTRWWRWQCLAKGRPRATPETPSITHKSSGVQMPTPGAHRRKSASVTVCGDFSELTATSQTPSSSDVPQCLTCLVPQGTRQSWTSKQRGFPIICHIQSLHGIRRGFLPSAGRGVFLSIPLKGQDSASVSSGRGSLLRGGLRWSEAQRGTALTPAFPPTTDKDRLTSWLFLVQDFSNHKAIHTQWRKRRKARRKKSGLFSNVVSSLNDRLEAGGTGSELQPSYLLAVGWGAQPSTPRGPSEGCW